VADPLRRAAEAALGTAGRAERAPLGPALHAQGSGWYPMLALCGLAFGDAVAAAALAFTEPAMRRSIGAGALDSFFVFGPVVFLVVAVLVVRFGGRRVPVALAGALLATLGLAGAAFATSAVGVLGAAVLTSIGAGAHAALLTPMLFDAHRPEVRVRAISAYGAATMSGVTAAVAVVALAGGAGLTWRGQLMIAAAGPLAAGLFALRLPEAPVGRFDRRRVTRLVEGRVGAVPAADAGHGLTVGGQFRRAVAPGAATALLVLAGVFGLFTLALPSFVDLFLRQRWSLAAPGRTLAYAVLCLPALPALAWFGWRGELEYRRSLGRLAHLAGSVAVATAVAVGAAATLPAFGLSVVALGIAFAGFPILLVTAIVLLLSLCEPVYRPHAATLLGGSVFLGGVLGQLAMATIGSRFGAGWALLTGAVGPLIGAAALASAITRADADLGALAERMLEADELAARAAAGQHLPLLSCRNIDFSYGQVQVLFRVSFTIDDGEMVALLGTNGAGKSTLLRLISGLSLPSSGSISFQGRDVTFFDTDRRVELGIAQIPGGRSVFGAMSVIDNLRAYGHTLGRDRARLERGIDEAFVAFPRLAERRNQLASTLSGGEQQMLGLGKAFILQPRLLLIDELSLGLAPLVVGQLLDMVRRINERGTAVVLVEQSVNIALSVVDHAYFMEKGEVRFDGRAADLLARPDLLRSVFLQGAAAGAQHP
jgi:ABC-type branched-subunit amino acid transport system ATPase component